jgi:hypothetical protein
LHGVQLMLNSFCLHSGKHLGGLEGHKVHAVAPLIAHIVEVTANVSSNCLNTE